MLTDKSNYLPNIKRLENQIDNWYYLFYYKVALAFGPVAICKIDSNIINTKHSFEFLGF